MTCKYHLDKKDIQDEKFKDTRKLKSQAEKSRSTAIVRSSALEKHCKASGKGDVKD